MKAVRPTIVFTLIFIISVFIFSLGAFAGQDSNTPPKNKKPPVIVRPKNDNNGQNRNNENRPRNNNRDNSSK